MVAPFPVCVPIHALSIPTYSIAACQLSLRGPLVSSLSIIVPSAASRIKCWDSINSIVIHSPSHHGWSCLQLPQEFQNTSLNPAGIIYVHSPPTMIGHGSSCFRNSIPTSLCLVISFSHLKNPPGNSLLIRLLVLSPQLPFFGSAPSFITPVKELRIFFTLYRKILYVRIIVVAVFPHPDCVEISRDSCFKVSGKPCCRRYSWDCW